MERLELSRSKAKHPPEKVAQERQQITSKVSKNESKKNRRQKMKLSNDAAGIRQRIEDLAAKVLPDRLARAEGIEYGAAVRQIIAEDERSTTCRAGALPLVTTVSWRRSWPRGWPPTRRDTAMTNDIDRRALDLLEREDAQAARDAERRDREAAESRVADARRIKENDAEIAAEHARKEAAAEAQEFVCQRHEVEERIEAEAMALNRSLSELQSLPKRQGAALRRAGRPLGHGHGLTDLITPWWRDRFGGFNSLTSTPSPHWNAEDWPLSKRDPLASADAGSDE